MRNINTWRVVYNITVFFVHWKSAAESGRLSFIFFPRTTISHLRPRKRHPFVSPSVEETDVGTSTILCSDEDGFALLNAAGCFDIHGLYTAAALVRAIITTGTCAQRIHILL